MSFKPRTDDIREASSVRALYYFLKTGAERIHLHDPIFTTASAPAKEIILARFIGELYKLFSLDNDFKNSYRIHSNELRRKKRKLISIETFFKNVYFPSFLNTGRVAFFDHVHELGPVDAIMLVTEHPEYEDIDFSQFKIPGKKLVVIDGRNHWYRRWKKGELNGVSYIGVGVPSSVANGAVRSELRSKTAVEITKVKLDNETAANLFLKRKVVIGLDALMAEENENLRKELVDVAETETDDSLQILILAPNERGLNAEEKIIRALGTNIFLKAADIQLVTSDQSSRLIQHTVKGAVNRKLTPPNAYNVFLPKLREEVGVYGSGITASVVVVDRPSSLKYVRNVARVVAAPLALKTALLISQLGDGVPNLNLNKLIVPSDSFFAQLKQLVSTSEIIKLAA